MPDRARLCALVVAAIVASSAGGLILTRTRPDTYDSKIMLEVTRSMVERGDFRVTDDELGLNSPYASYGLGMSLAFAVPYTAVRAVGAQPATAVNAAMTTNAFFFAFTTVAVMALARSLHLSWSGALGTAALIAGGTMLLPYVATGFSELAVAALVALGLLAIRAQRGNRAWAAALGGAAGGAAVLFRTDSLVTVLPIVAAGVWLASGRQGRALVRLAAGALPFLLVCAWYNDLRFGSPFEFGYSNPDVASFSHPFLSGLYGLLLSPSRGLLWFVPLVVVAAVGARWAWRRDRVLALAAAALFAVRPLFFASWTAWGGGVCWGPRFLVPAMPALAVGVVEVVRRFRQWGRPLQLALGAVVALSGFVQMVGAVVGYEHHFNRLQPVAVAHGDPQAYFLNWSYFPIPEQAAWLFTRPDLYAGRALPPSRNVAAFTVLSLLAVAGAAVAVRNASALDREVDRGTSVPRPC